MYGLNYLSGYGDQGILILRLVVAVIFMYHAVPKFKTPEAMGKGIGWSAQKVQALGWFEMVSGILLIIGGWLTSLGSFVLAVVMVGAIWHKAMKWNVPFAAHDKTGWEFDLLLLAACLAIYLTSGGGLRLFGY